MMTGLPVYLQCTVTGFNRVDGRKVSHNIKSRNAERRNRKQKQKPETEKRKQKKENRNRKQKQKHRNTKTQKTETQKHRKSECVGKTGGGWLDGMTPSGGFVSPPI